MGSPVICDKCGRKNGLLTEHCRCGHIISRNGHSSHKHGDPWLPAVWETVFIPDIWRAVHKKEMEKLQIFLGDSEEEFINNLTKPSPGNEKYDIEINAHEFLKYANMLNNMQLQFDLDDDKHWFNECIFFLRGGYEFFKHLHSTTNIQNRVTIFGGLNHSARPADRLREWLKKVVIEASARNMKRIDIFVAEEITGGSSTKRICKVIRDGLIAENYQNSLDMTFTFYLASGGTTKYEDSTARSVLCDIRRYKAGEIMVTNEFIIFDGPVYTYDQPIFNGLNVSLHPPSYKEKYIPMVLLPWNIKLICPGNKRVIFTIAPGNNDLSSWMGNEIVNLLRPQEDEKYYRNAYQAFNSSCSICKALFNQLRNPNIYNYNLFGTEYDNCVRTRAYYLWKNKSDKYWEDDLHNWIKAEELENSRLIYK